MKSKINVCFVGLGSIASRHINNLKDIYGNGISVDVLRIRYSKDERCCQRMSIPETLNSFVRNIYYRIEDLPHNYDVIFITNPTRLHYDTLKMVHGHGKHFFIEKPVFENGYEDIDELGLREDSIYYVACPLRYTNVIRYLKENIDFSEVYSVRCISSSYLPEWRPGIDYRNTYSARKELGGGVSIDLIHEWDYLCYLIGTPLSIKSFIAKKSNLEIDSDDVAVYIAEYKDKLVELHLDYFGRETIRRIELFGKDDSMEADLVKQKITWRKSGKIIELVQERNEYQKRELMHFFNIIEGKIPNDNDIITACKTLRITRGV